MSVIMNQKKEILEKLAFIRRHKEFASFGVKEQEVSYNPCLSEEDIKGFEHKGQSLPLSFDDIVITRKNR